MKTPRAVDKKLLKRQNAAERELKKIAQLRRQRPRREIQDHVLVSPRGPVKLSKLFGKKKDLMIVHNMGASCRGCTLWGDGFSGLYPHLADRTSFVVISPDSPKAQKKFARSRGWKFPMISDPGSSLSWDLGFQRSKDDWWPGISTFQKKNGRIYHVTSVVVGPYDPYCGLWHMFSLLADGVDDWEPKYRY